MIELEHKVSCWLYSDYGDTHHAPLKV
jgi:hypothetical protein